ncbi:MULTISPECIES: hypothetical protein [unclassified Crossiella]|uniref:hypothetical protein n=1 Tax=unclassified Crossiella TaxID=2620835 RepID=UPI001FFE77F1|nr:MULTISPECIES: hypothetical protein [unclassified Crossiella]MCK2240065.1 hypothetical protein [Crossiella sp. S99.2]MCK2252773.1 hypothetical protein [Crossiella sp. S99.1]
MLDVLKEYDLTEPDADARAVVKVGEPYRADTFPCGHAIKLANDLIQNAPEAAFTTYEEPAYDWLGITCLYVPGLGQFTAYCDGDGNPVFTQTEILQLAAEPDEVRLEKLGVPWLTAISAMPQTAVAAPDCQTTG